MKKIISILTMAITALVIIFGCNNSATGNTSSDTATHVDSFKPPAVTEGGIRDTTMRGLDSTQSKDSTKK